MNKQEILDIINKNLDEKTIDRSIFSENEVRGKIGNNQFRELANICKTAQCSDEVVLLVKYSTAKAGRNSSWGIAQKNNESFGSIIVKCMEQVIGNEKNDVVKLENLSLFFGYLYWNARIWTSEQPAPQCGGRR